MSTFVWGLKLYLTYLGTVCNLVGCNKTVPSEERIKILRYLEDVEQNLSSEEYGGGELLKFGREKANERKKKSRLGGQRGKEGERNKLNENERTQKRMRGKLLHEMVP